MLPRQERDAATADATINYKKGRERCRRARREERGRETPPPPTQQSIIKKGRERYVAATDERERDRLLR